MSIKLANAKLPNSESLHHQLRVRERAREETLEKIIFSYFLAKLLLMKDTLTMIPIHY